MRDIRDDLKERLAHIQAAMNAAVDQRDERIMTAQNDYRQIVDALSHERGLVLELLTVEDSRPEFSEGRAWFGYPTATGSTAFRVHHHKASFKRSDDKGSDQGRGGPCWLS